MTGHLTLAELRASSPAPNHLPVVLADEQARGRIERVGGGYALTPAGLRELQPLHDLTPLSPKETTRWRS